MAPTLLYNASIYTFSRQKPLVEGMAIENGTVLQVGTRDELQHSFPGGQQINLEGRTILPGLIDGHLHFKQLSENFQKINCETPMRDDCLRNVSERAKTTPSGQWILGHGWNQNLWEEGFGDPRDLAALTPHHPVYLTAKSLHAGWVNPAALELAGVTKNTPDPPGGRFSRDASGQPTGFVFEKAMGMISAVIPEPAVGDLVQAMENAQSELWKMGLTGFHDFDREHSFRALQELHRRGKLKMRVLKHINVQNFPEALKIGLRSGFGDDFLRIGGVKCFADGALGPRTAAMLEPYENSPREMGMLFYSIDELTELGLKAVDHGFNLAIHAIGDRANRLALDAYAQIRRFEHGNNLPHFRHRIEHVQLLHPRDIHRLADLDIIASMQPLHATSDRVMADRLWGERTRYAYAFQTQLEKGARLVFGSDAPVESANPFLGIHAAVTRRTPGGAPGHDGWIPEERLALDETLRAYTTGPAFAAGMENRQGVLTPGAFADLIVLDQDPFQVDFQELAAFSPAATMVNGEWVWQTADFQLP